MTPAQDRPFDELRFALAEADALAPPTPLGEAIRQNALAARPAGIPIDAPPPIDPRQAFLRGVEAFDEALRSLSPADWRKPALRRLDVQGLVGHLIGVEHGFQRAMETTDDAHADDDHIASTDHAASEQLGREPGDTLEAWRRAVQRTAARLEETEQHPEDLERPVALYGLRLPLHTWLVVRTFELWTHEEDIRRATAQPLRSPDAATLRLMTNLAVGLVPAAMARADRLAEGRSARIVLTGPGGGAWHTGLGLTDVGRVLEGPADVRIVASAVDFCRVVANRLDAASLEADITGDATLARDVLVGAATLALD